MNIKEYTVEEIKDPTGILAGQRFEFFLTVEFDEEDELANEDHLQIKILFSVDDNGSHILNYHFYDSLENKYLDYGLEEDELAEIQAFLQATLFRGLILNQFRSNGIKLIKLEKIISSFSLYTSTNFPSSTIWCIK